MSTKLRLPPAAWVWRRTPLARRWLGQKSLLQKRGRCKCTEDNNTVIIMNQPTCEVEERKGAGQDDWWTTASCQRWPLRPCCRQRAGCQRPGSTPPRAGPSWRRPRWRPSCQKQREGLWRPSCSTWHQWLTDTFRQTWGSLKWANLEKVKVYGHLSDLEHLEKCFQVHKSLKMPTQGTYSCSSKIM